MLAFFLGYGHHAYAQEWTVYLLLQAQDSYEEATATIDQWERALVGDIHGQIKLSIDLQAGDHSQRIRFEKGIRQNIPSPQEDDSVALIKKGCEWAFEDAVQGRTLLILSGHGTGILSPRFDQTLKRWFFEPDQGSSPCVEFCARQYEAFCKKIEYIMEGKSALLSQGGNSFVEPSSLHSVCDYVTQTILGRKIDIMGFDSCYMAMYEIAYELKEHCHVLVGSQECEDKEGWHYQEVAHILSLGLDTIQTARKLVVSHDRVQRLRELDRYSLAAFDLHQCDALAQALDTMVTLLIPQMQKSTPVVRALCAARTRLHKMAGLPFYVDLREFFEEFLSELSSVERSLEVQALIEALCVAREAHATMMIASVAGPLCRRLHGCSLYFPRSHIDSSYAGLFVAEHRWKTFLDCFTQGKINGYDY